MLIILCFFSLAYITEHMDPKNKLAPLFEAQLELLEPDMVFAPTLDPNDEKGFTAMVNGIIDDILKMSALIERIDTTKEQSYEDVIVNNDIVIEMKEEILNAIEKVGKIVFSIISKNLNSGTFMYRTSVSGN